MLPDILKSYGYSRKIRKKQFDAPERLRNYQWSRLKETLHFAFTKIPYYIETYEKAGMGLQDIQTWEDFRKLPILTKQEKRSHPPEAFLPWDIKKNKTWKTHAIDSAGMPMTVFRNSDSTAFDRALIQYCFDRLGIKSSHRICQMISMLSEKPRMPGRSAGWGFKRHFVVSARQADDEIVRQILALKPHVLWAFPSTLLRLGEYISSRKIQFNLRWLIAQGEVLPESWRLIIQKAFHAPLYHTYGSNEMVRSGFECHEHHGYHLIADAAITEVLHDGEIVNANEEGELVMTSLNNFCSPLIRYQTGDHGIVSSKLCACGVTYPLLTNVTGRSDDFIVLPSGRRVSLRAITYMQFEGIIQYKIIQKSAAHLQILVIPSATFGAQAIQEIRKVVASSFFGEQLVIEIIPREFLPATRVEKLQFVKQG